MIKRAKVVLAGMIGNALEFYDFTLYGFFAPIIAIQFFPNQNSDGVTSLLLALSVYAVGFLMRPLGAVIFGHIGDRYGRKKALTLSVVLMAVPTTLIGLLPSYAVIGVFAPIILTLCRLLQGLCTGGEYNGAAIFVIEHQKNKRGFAGGLITSSCAIGSLLGVGIGYVCTLQERIFSIESWRLPFLFGILIGGVGMYIRRKLDESPEFLEAMAKKALDPTARSKAPPPLKQALAKHWRSVLCILGISWLNGVMYYASFNYVSIYLNKTFQWAVNDTLPVLSVALITYAVMTPIVGGLADRYGTIRMMRSSAVLVMILAVPLFWLITTADLTNIVVAQVLLALLAAFFSGGLNFFMQSLFPVEDRYSGIAVSYSVGMAVFGGTTLLIMEALRMHVSYPAAPALWVGLSGLAATLVLTLLYPKIQLSQKA